jgi:hypothetical protein
MVKKVYPFLRLPGPIEIDEAKIGVQRWHYKGEFPKNIKWAFGVYCRSTQIAIVYEISTKNHAELVSIMKAHCAPGSVMISD